MLTIAYAYELTLKDYYELVIDKAGTPVVIEGLAADFQLLRLKLLSTSSDEGNVYTAEVLFETEVLDKPLIATLELESIFPRYGVSDGKNAYGIVCRGDEYGPTLARINTVPAHKERI